MKPKEKYASSRQLYIRTSDTLSALRSAKGLIYVVLIAALIFTVVFNSMFGIYSIPGARLKDTDGVAVVAEKTRKGLRNGDVVIVDDGNGCYCAELKVTEDGYYTGSEDEPVRLKEENIIGRARFVLLPVNRFGDNPIKLIV